MSLPIETRKTTIMRIKTTLGFAVAAALAASASWAQTVINFDDLTAPTFITQGPNQGHYVSQGINFDSEGFILGKVVADVNAPTSPNVLDITDYTAVEFKRSLIRGVFVQGQHHYVQMLVGARWGQAGGGGGQVYLTAYDLGNNVVGTSQLTVSNSATSEGWVPLSVTSQGQDIASFVVDGGDNEYILIDNLQFDTLTGPPQPDFSLANQSQSGSDILIFPFNSSSSPNVSSTATLKIQLQRLNGSDGNISYSVPNLPPHVHLLSITPMVSMNTANDLVRVVLQADSMQMPVLNQVVTFTATPAGSAGSHVHSVNFNLTVGGTYDARIVNMEVTQGIQNMDLAARTVGPDGDLTPSVPYSGVDLAAGGKTVVRVFAGLKTPLPTPNNTQLPQVSCYLYGYDQNNQRLPGSPLQTLQPTSPSAASLPCCDDYVTDQQRLGGDYRFTLPEPWTHGTISLRATLVASIPAFTPTLPPSWDCCPNNDTFTLTGISFVPVPDFSFNAMALGVNNLPPGPAHDAYDQLAPTPPWAILGQGINLLPLGESQASPASLNLLDYAVEFDITPTYDNDNDQLCFQTCSTWIPGNPCATICGTFGLQQSMVRALNIMFQMSTAGDQFNCFQPNKIVVGIFPYSDPTSGLQDRVRNFTYVVDEAAIVGLPIIGTFNFGSWAIPNNMSVFEDGSRPLTAAIHEVSHQFWRVHASGAGGASDTSNGCYEDWPPDQQGYLDGVGFDRSSPLGQARISGVGGSGNYYDFMSYAADDNEDGDPNSWISPKGWEETIHFFTNGPGTFPEPGWHCASFLGFTAGQDPGSPGPGLLVRALVIDTNVNIFEVTAQNLAAVPPPLSSAYHLQALDMSGNLLTEVPMSAGVARDAGANVSFLVAKVPVTNAASVTVTLNGNLVSQITRSANAPVVQITGVQSDVPSSSGQPVTVITWTATDADNDPLKTAVDYSPDNGQTWRGLFYGPNTNYLAVPNSRFSASREGVIRVRVSDGFNETAALSSPFAEVGSPPVVFITSPVSGTTFGNEETLHCSGSATDDRRQPILDDNVWWYAGKKQVGQGRTISVTGLAPCSQTLTMVARDYLGRTGSASVTINVTQFGLPTNPFLANPTLINTNIALWLTADTGVQADSNGLVSVWADQSGLGNDALQANPGNQPIYVANAIQGRPAVQFGISGNQLLTIAGQVLTGTQFTIVAVINDQASNATSRVLLSSFTNTSSAPPVSLGLSEGYPNPVSVQFSQEFGPGAAILGGPQHVSVLSAVVTNGPGCSNTTSLYQNQRLIGTATLPCSVTNTLAGPYAIGALSGGSGDTFWRGEIAEVLVYNTGLSQTEMQQVYGYLQAKYVVLPGTPQIASLQITNNSVLITFNTEANRTYLLQAADSLGPNPMHWVTITKIFSAPRPATVVVPDSLSRAQRFYRLVIPAA